MLFSFKYAPKKLDELAGNEDQRSKIRQWLLNWLNGHKQSPLLVHGNTGTGKTSVATVLAQEYGLLLIEMSSSDLRNKASIDKVLQSASSSATLYGNQKILLVDDVDALQSADSGGASAISKILKENSVPIILTATDIWDKKLSGIRSECQQIEFKKVTKSSIISVLKRIAKSESLEISEDQLKLIAENANGDVRAAINDFQSSSTASRDTEKDIFERVRTIFKSMSYSEAKKSTYGDVEYDLLKLWIDENIPVEYSAPEDVAQAYYWLSKADLYDGRIKRSHWGYLRYSFDFLTAGVALSKQRRSSSFVRYQFPSYLRAMGQTVDRRAKLKSIGKKIGKITHSNFREARDYLYLIKHFLESDLNSTVSFYNFEEDEAAFILETTPNSLKKNSAKKASDEPEKEAQVEKKEDPKQTKEESKKSEPSPKSDKKKPLSGSLKDFF
ncbi:replication factor C large subunit [Candidatus Micrarchaeota archaeon]|nr:replication factor C large subunit [Candidatus Micrarchaeota archaeon]